MYIFEHGPLVYNSLYYFLTLFYKNNSYFQQDTDSRMSDHRPLACNSEDPDILTELAIQRSLDCPTPTGRETPTPNIKIKDVTSNEFPQCDNEASPMPSPLRYESDKEESENVNDKSVDEEHLENVNTANVDVEAKIVEDEAQMKVKGTSIIQGKQESCDMQRKENSAAEALITLAGQDNIIRHRSPGPVQPNIIRTLQTMSAKYINDEPILKESEKIEMFSEIPTTDSEEESLEIRRLRFVTSHIIYLNLYNFFYIILCELV